MDSPFDGDDMAGREMMLEGFDNVPNSKEHGFEYRSLDNGLYDKYWRYKYYQQCEKAHHTGKERTG
jgi:hypothetical protein